MNSEWPGRWHSKTSDDGERYPEMSNDHGIRLLMGENMDEWLKMWGDVPENRC